MIVPRSTAAGVGIAGVVRQVGLSFGDAERHVDRVGEEKMDCW